MPPWFIGSMVESRMADRRREAVARRSTRQMAPERPNATTVVLHRSRLARWVGQMLIAGGGWLAGPDGAMPAERSAG